MEEYLVSTDTRGATFPDEASLVRESRNNPGSFTQFYNAYIRLIYRYIYSKVGEVRQTEDLTGQVFLEALASLPHYRHDGHFAACLPDYDNNRSTRTVESGDWNPDWGFEGTVPGAIQSRIQTTDSSIICTNT